MADEEVRLVQHDADVTAALSAHCKVFHVDPEVVRTVDDNRIHAWVTTFVRALGLSWKVCFDFIRTQDGTPDAIECNPRTRSAITMFHDHPGVLGAASPPSSRTSPAEPTYWLYHEVWRALTHPSRLLQRARVSARGKDAIFDGDDPLPFLMVHHAQIPWLLPQDLRRRGSWIRIDANIGKLVEPAGDGCWHRRSPWPGPRSPRSGSMCPTGGPPPRQPPLAAPPVVVEPTSTDDSEGISLFLDGA